MGIDCESIIVLGNTVEIGPSLTSSSIWKKFLEANPDYDEQPAKDSPLYDDGYIDPTEFSEWFNERRCPSKKDEHLPEDGLYLHRTYPFLDAPAVLHLSVVDSETCLSKLVDASTKLESLQAKFSAMMLQLGDIEGASAAIVLYSAVCVS